MNVMYCNTKVQKSTREIIFHYTHAPPMVATDVLYLPSYNYLGTRGVQFINLHLTYDLIVNGHESKVHDISYLFGSLFHTTSLIYYQPPQT